MYVGSVDGSLLVILCLCYLSAVRLQDVCLHVHVYESLIHEDPRLYKDAHCCLSVSRAIMASCSCFELPFFVASKVLRS